MKAIVILPLILIVTGCAIGFETVAPDTREVSCVLMDNEYFHIYDQAKKEYLIKKLGEPDFNSDKIIRYDNDNIQWEGFAIDLSVLQLPITIPLMIPTGKGGYVLFKLENGQVDSITAYKNFSNFYGYGIGEGKSGWYTGQKSGIWFDTE